ncbi:sensor histidine kinase [Methanocalculus chunghsingensis]|uniref:sensor histidine kinase n=1 Tax=Methanocalculus chunghsingensis TaxID=156457 RepID=UPI001B8A900A|nr:GAF domain-containing sensor histidine kinase [Methanocalculus chunghsingensis]
MHSSHLPVTTLKVSRNGEIHASEGEGGAIHDHPLFAGISDQILGAGEEVHLSGRATGLSLPSGHNLLITPGPDDDLIYYLSPSVDACTERKALEEAYQQLRILHAVVESASSKHTCQDILQTCLWETIRLIDVDCGAIYLQTDDPDRMERRVMAGYIEYCFGSRMCIDVSSPPFSSVMTGKKPVFLEEYMDLDHADGELGVYSLAILPILSRGEVIGVICCAHSKPRRYSRQEEDILTSIGRSIGGAVRRAVLQQKYNDAMEENTLLLDIMEHDIRNANMVTEGYLEMLLGTPSEEYLRRAQAGIRQSSGIIRNVNTIRLIGSSEKRLEPVSLDRVIGDETGLFPKAEIAWEKSGIIVYADDLLPRIFNNLIGNSLKFGGDETRITISVRPEGDRVCITVQDDGPGIPPDLRPILFSRYTPGDDRRSGSGLGLYIVRQLVHRYGGEIAVIDQPTGAGISFWLRRAG